MRSVRFAISLSLLLVFSVFSKVTAQSGTWVEHVSGNSSELPRAIAVEPGGDFYVAGEFQDTIYIGAQTLVSAGKTDIFIAKYAADGSFVWANRYGWKENDHVSALKLDGSGNLFAAGEYQDSSIFNLDTLYINTFSADTQGISDGLVDVYVLKLNSAGAFQWVHDGGGWGSEFIHDIALTATGEVLVCGEYRTRLMLKDTLLNTGYDDIYLARMSASGAWEWSEKAGGVLFESARGIELVGDTAIFITGFFQDTVYFKDSTVFVASKGDEDIFLAKYDSAGTFRWVKSMGGKYEEKVTGMAQDASGNLYISGFFTDTMDIPGVQLYSVGNTDGFLLKMDPQGNLVWYKTFGGAQFDMIESISIEGNTLALTGFFQGTAYLDAYAVVTNSPFNQDVFYASMDLAGNVNWTRSGGGVSVDAGRAIGLDGGGYMYVAGDFGDTAHFASVDLVATRQLDMFILRIDANGSVEVQEAMAGNSVSVVIWPNPAVQQARIRMEGAEAGKGMLTIQNLQGATVMQKSYHFQAGMGEMEFDVSAFQSGMYLVTLQSENMTVTTKLVVNR